MNRSKRIKFPPPAGGQLLPRPGGKGGARRNPEAALDSWIGRNLYRDKHQAQLCRSRFWVLKGASACPSRKTEGVLCRTFGPPRLSARTALTPGPRHKWAHQDAGNVKLYKSPGRAGGLPKCNYFLDADTFLDRGLAKIVSTYMEGKGLLTIQPYHRMEKAPERLSAVFNILTVAGMNTFTPWGEKVKPMGAFGPCNVCSREDYFHTGGHQKVRGEVLESLGLGKQFLKANRKVRLFGGKGAISFHMYSEGIGSMIEGFSKGFGTGAKAMSPPILIMAICWITGGVGVIRHFLHSLILTDSLSFLVSSGMYLLLDEPLF